MIRFFILILFLYSKNTFGQQDNFFLEMEMERDSICSSNLKLQLDEKVGKFGFVDSSGNFVIEPEYYCATEFIDCIALTSRKKRCLNSKKSSKDIWWYINKNNNMVIPPRVEHRTRWENEIKTTHNTSHAK
jgi:hypothetical protein